MLNNRIRMCMFERKNDKLSESINIDEKGIDFALENLPGSDFTAVCKSVSPRWSDKLRIGAAPFVSDPSSF